MTSNVKCKKIEFSPKDRATANPQVLSSFAVSLNVLIMAVLSIPPQKYVPCQIYVNMQSPHIFAAYFAILWSAYFEKKCPRYSDMPILYVASESWCEGVVCLHYWVMRGWCLADGFHRFVLVLRVFLTSALLHIWFGYRKSIQSVQNLFQLEYTFLMCHRSFGADRHVHIHKTEYLMKKKLKNDVWPVCSNAGTVAMSSEAAIPSDTVDLQVDYWMSPPRSDSQDRGDRTLRKEVKCSLKTMFRSMRVFRMPSSSALLPPATADTVTPSALSMIVVTLEKKQKSTATYLLHSVVVF